MSNDTSNEKKYERLVEVAQELELDIIILMGKTGDYNGALVGDPAFLKWFQENVEKADVAAAMSSDDFPDGDGSGGMFH